MAERKTRGGAGAPGGRGGPGGAWETFQPLFRPASIAVVGASENPGPGLQVLENLQQLGYAGKVHPVNPRYQQVLGRRCYPSLSAVREAGQTIDMVAVLLGRDRIVPVLEEAAAAGARAAWAFASGFGEAGADGRELQGRLSALCARHGMHFLGPNCVGFRNPSVGAGTWSAPAPSELRRGRIGMVAQSGYLCLAVANSPRGVGFSLIASTGNEAVVDATDCIAYMLEDPETDVVMAFIEQFRRPQQLRVLAARAREVAKPIVLIKVGRSEMARRATAAHTGALAGSDDVQDALLRKLNLIRVEDLDEMFETALLFAGLKGRLPAGERVSCVTLSGGVISLLADVGENSPLRFPGWSPAGRQKVQALLPPYAEVGNPLDAWGFGRVEESYEACLLAAVEEPEADLVLVAQDVPPGMAPRQVAQYAVVARAAAKAAAASRKPIVLLGNTSTGIHPEIGRILAEGGVPFLQGTREGLKALGHAVRYARGLSAGQAAGSMAGQEAGGASGARGAPALVLRPDERGGLTEHRSKQVLREFGVPCTREILCASLEQTLAAAREVGFPVVLKVMSPQILHKTEAGALALGLADEDAVRRAYERLLANARAYAPEARIDGMLVYQLAPQPVAEVIVGILRDPHFGPAVVFGSGGILVEVLRDRSLGIPPLDLEEARAMIESTRGYRLLTGFRGRPRADVQALADVLVKVGRLAEAGAERVEALDINPLLVYPEGKGVLAVDALLVLRED